MIERGNEKNKMRHIMALHVYIEEHNKKRVAIKNKR
jgi:hypothetical protein